MRLVKTISSNPNRAMDFVDITMIPEYIRGISELREKYQVPAPEELDDQTAIRFLESNDINDDVLLLLKNLQQPSSWSDVVAENLIFGTYYSYCSKDNDLLQDNQGLVVSINLDDVDDITMQVGPHTKKDDFEKAWDLITQYREKSPRIRTKAMYLRDMYVIRFAFSGLTISQILIEVDKLFPGEDELHGISENYIRKIVSEFCDKYHISKVQRPKILSNHSNLPSDPS